MRSAHSALIRSATLPYQGVMTEPLPDKLPDPLPEPLPDPTAAVAAATTLEPKPAARRVMITGASGALGGAMARRLAAPGTSLLLWGRDSVRLAAIADLCRAAGATVEMRQIELADTAAAVAALAADDDAAGITAALLVAGQGDSLPGGAVVESPEQVARLATVNFAAPAALAAAIAARMVARGQGQILVVGSAAGFHTLPQAAAYAASKAGLAHFAQALRVAVAPHGVQVTLVSPGFIQSASGDRPLPSLLMISVETAARRILAAFDAGNAHAIIPRRFALLRALDRLLPRPLRDRVLRAMQPG